MPNIHIFYKPSNGDQDDGKIEPLQFGVNNNWREPRKNYGPESGIGSYISGSRHRMGLVKYAYGGSKLVITNTPSSNGYWQTDAFNVLNHYSILIRNWANQSLDAFRKQGYKPYIAAFVWCQGENDAHDAQAARQYKNKLLQLLDTFKKDMAGKDEKVNNMRVIITRTRKGYPYSDIVRKAQEDIAATYLNAYLVNSDEWPLEKDGIHFTAETQATLHGKAIADILQKVIP